MKGECTIRGLCQLLGVSPSGYYRWQAARPTKRQSEDAMLADKIAAAHRRSRKNYGSPRIVEELRAEGTQISKRRCARLMHAQGLRGKKKHCRQVIVPQWARLRCARRQRPHLQVRVGRFE